MSGLPGPWPPQLESWCLESTGPAPVPMLALAILPPTAQKAQGLQLRFHKMPSHCTLRGPWGVFQKRAGVFAHDTKGLGMCTFYLFLMWSWIWKPVWENPFQIMPRERTCFMAGTWSSHAGLINHAIVLPGATDTRLAIFQLWVKRHISPGHSKQDHFRERWNSRGLQFLWQHDCCPLGDIVFAPPSDWCIRLQEYNYTAISGRVPAVINY